MTRNRTWLIALSAALVLCLFSSTAPTVARAETGATARCADAGNATAIALCEIQYNAKYAAITSLPLTVTDLDPTADAQAWNAAVALGVPTAYAAYVTGWKGGITWVDDGVMGSNYEIYTLCPSLPEPSWIPGCIANARWWLNVYTDARPTAVNNAQVADNRSAKVYAAFVPRSDGVDVTFKSAVGSIVAGSNKVVDGRAQVTIDVSGSRFTWADGVGEFKVYPTPVQPTTDVVAMTVTIANKTWTGKQVKPLFTVKADGVTLKVGTDFTVKYGTNVAIGKGTVTITGVGVYNGTKVVSFKITPTQAKITKIKAKKRAITVYWKKVSSKQKVSGYLVQYQKQGSTVWKSKWVSSKKSSVTIKKLSKGKFYLVRVATHKKVSGVRYYSDLLYKKSKRVK